MESLIGLVNRIQRACTALGDYGGGEQAFSSLWDALPSVAVVGGQVRISNNYIFIIYLFFVISNIVELLNGKLGKENLDYFGYI